MLKQCDEHAQVITRARAHEDLSEIKKIAERLKIPSSVTAKAKSIFQEAKEKGLTRGHSDMQVAAASLYAACRLTSRPVFLGEIAMHSHAYRKDITRCYRLLLRELELKMPMINPTIWVPRISKNLCLREETQKTAVDILREVEGLAFMAGRSPSIGAGAAIYLACIINTEHKRKMDVAVAARCSETSLRNHYKSFIENIPWLRDMLEGSRAQG